MKRNSIELQVLVNGRPVKEHSINDRIFIESRKGTEYTIKVNNGWWNRGLATVTVDGVDVLSGKAGLESNSGYIVDGYSSIEIKGFRISDDEVARFVFDDKHKSYASTVGPKVNGVNLPDRYNNGVIGIRFELEKYEYLPVVLNTNPTYSYRVDYLSHEPIYGDQIFNTSCSIPNKGRSRSTPRGITAQSCRDDVPDFECGTAWGSQQTDRVVSSEFKSGGAVYYMELYYSTREDLENTFGINLRNPKKKVYPSAFSKYCTPPHA